MKLISELQENIRKTVNLGAVAAGHDKRKIIEQVAFLSLFLFDSDICSILIGVGRLGIT